MTATPPGILEIDSRPLSRRRWLSDLWGHRDVIVMMARADFHVRYKRAAFGVAWAVAVPLIQAAVLIVVFSRLIRVGSGSDFSAYVLGGIMAWSYLAGVIGASSIAIVEGRNLTDKVWFPRAMLPLVPALANVVGLAISLAIVVVALPFLGGTISWRLLLLPVAVVLLVVFTTALSLVLAALHVYFRDVRFLVQAAMLVWFYITPIAYPVGMLGRLSKFLTFNPMTGVVDLVRLATVGHQPYEYGAIAYAVGVTLVLVVITVEVYRRHDRLFVDRL